jgi:hypothetical protein
MTRDAMSGRGYKRALARFLGLALPLMMADAGATDVQIMEPFVARLAGGGEIRLAAGADYPHKTRKDPPDLRRASLGKWEEVTLLNVELVKSDDFNDYLIRVSIPFPTNEHIPNPEKKQAAAAINSPE